MTDRQTNAVDEAIKSSFKHNHWVTVEDCEAAAQAAIAASDARFVPELVEALQEIADQECKYGADDKPYSEVDAAIHECKEIAKEALSKLPEDLLK